VCSCLKVQCRKICGRWNRYVWPGEHPGCLSAEDPCRPLSGFSGGGLAGLIGVTTPTLYLSRKRVERSYGSSRPSGVGRVRVINTSVSSGTAWGGLAWEEPRQQVTEVKRVERMFSSGKKVDVCERSAPGVPAGRHRPSKWGQPLSRHPAMGAGGRQ